MCSGPEVLAPGSGARAARKLPDDSLVADTRDTCKHGAIVVLYSVPC